jgi:hypothetical protein
MRAYVVLTVIASLIVLGCYSTPNLGGGGSFITTSKNFTMKEGWEDSFTLVEGGSTVTHSMLMSKVQPNAVLLKIDSHSLLMHVGEVKSIQLGGSTVVVTLSSIEDGYVRFIISLPGQGQSNQPTGNSSQGQQNGTQNQTLTPNGSICVSDPECQSSHCSNGYCCALGQCCLSDSNCPAGEKCNTTTYSCFSPSLQYNGDSCNSKSDCQSNYCSNGHCCASGKCCLSSSNCASGEVCNTTSSSCVQSIPAYNPSDAERKANSTTDGLLMATFSSLFNSARQCSTANSAFIQCIPRVSVRDEQTSVSTYNVIYSNSFSGASCCLSTDVLVITVDLSTNSATPRWIDTAFTQQLAATMQSNLNSNCATAVQYMACKTS